MIAPPMRLLEEWLSDPTNGVNAMLATLPVETGDPVVREVTVASQISNGQVAVGRPTKNLPMIGISFVQMVDLDPTMAVSTRAAQPAYLIRYHGEAARAQEIVFESFQVSWAVMRSLKRFFQFASDAQRSRGGIHMLQCERLEVGPVQPDVEGEPVTAGVIVVPQIEDINP